MYLISYKMIYGVDLQRCVLQEIASLDKKETERPTSHRILLSIKLHDKWIVYYQLHNMA